MSLHNLSPARTGPLPVSHAALAVLVMAVWGTNFAVIEVGLAQFPPLIFAFLRFVFVLLPAIIFVRPPKLQVWRLVAYGLLIGGGQFGALYVALHGLISPGIASLVVQSQVFFTIVLSAAIFKDRIRPLQILALAVAAAGLAVVAIAGGGEATAPGLGLVLIAGTAWAGANLLMKGTPSKDMVAFVIWASWFALPPLLLLSLLVEGPTAILRAITAATPAGWAAVLWQSIGNSLFGFAAWGWLLARHPAPVVAPTALLVPVFGMLASAVWLGEAMAPWKILAAVFVIGGLAINLLATRPARSATPSTL